MDRVRDQGTRRSSVHAQSHLERVDLLRASVRLLPRAELVTFAGVGHGLLPVIDAAMDRAAAFVRTLAV